MSRRRPRPRVACLVVGPHRSGTSAVTGVLGLLGVDLGSDLLPPAPANPRGYFELRRIVEAHDALLEQLGLSWEEPGPLPPGWWRGKAGRRCGEEIEEVLRAEVHGSPLWAVKDPRMCRLMPMWRSLLRTLECRPLVVLVLRHPEEVVGSLAKRDELAAERSRLLWLEHMLRAEADTRHWPRVLVAYDDLLADWRSEIDRIAAAGSITWPRGPDQQRKKIEGFLSPSLHHHREAASEVPDTEVSEWTSGVYAALRRSSDLADPRLRAELTAVRRSLDKTLGVLATEARAVSAPLRQELARHRAVRGELDAEIDALRRQNEELVEEVSRQRATRGELESELERQRRSRGEVEEEARRQRASREELEEELARHRSTRAELEAEIEAHRRSLAELRQELSRRESARAALGDQNEELASEVDRLRARSEELAEGRSIEQAAKADLERQLEALRSDRDTLRRDLNRHRATLDRLAGLGESAATVMDHLARRGASGSELEEGLQAVRSQGGGLAKDLSRFRGAVSSLAAAARRIRAKSRSLEREADRVSTSRFDLEGELAEARRRLTEQSRLLDSLVNSRSWRITRPLRELAESLRRLRPSRQAAEVAPRQVPPQEPEGELVSSIDLFHVLWEAGRDERVIAVAGWCFARGRSEPVRLELRSGHGPIAEALCTVSRPDVAAAFGLGNSASVPACGFNLKVPIPARFDRLELVGPDGTVLAERSRAELLPAGQIEPYEAFRANHALRPHLRNLLAGACDGFAWYPEFSLVVDPQGADPQALAGTLESLRDQVYDRWELRLASRPDETPPELPAAPVGGWKVETPAVEAAASRSAAFNAAAAQAGGEFLAFLEPGDRLEPQALFEVVRRLQGDRRADVVYHDHEIVDRGTGRRRPWLKPDFSPVLLLGCDYIGPFFFMRRSLFREVGGFDEGRGAARGHDLLLRASERSDRWAHVARLLGSATRPPEAAERPWAAPSVEAARPVVERALLRRSLDATVRAGDGDRAPGPRAAVGLEWPDSGPHVTIVVPTYNRHELLRRCIDSVMEQTSYRDFDLLIVDNGSDAPASLAYLDGLAGPRIRVLRVPRDEGGFSFSAVNNRAVRETDADLVLFLNNDTEAVEPRWLSRLVGYCGLPGVGAAGARLLYPDGSIQHGGVVLQMNDGLAPGHAFYGHRGEDGGYGDLAQVPREVAAVTAACMLTPRRLFLELGGFDESYPVVLNDVDYCLRLADRGLRSIYVADAMLIHAESRSRDKLDDPGQLARFKRRYRRRPDPYYNPGLIREPKRSFEIDPAGKSDDYRFLDRPLRLLCVAVAAPAGPANCLPWSALEGLGRRGLVLPEVATSGELPSTLAGGDLLFHHLDLRGAREAAAGDGTAVREWLDRILARLFAERSPDVVMAVGLADQPVVEAAAWASLPTIWMIPELQSAPEINRLESEVPQFARALRTCHRVVFPSYEARSLFERFNRRLNFGVLYNTVPLAEIDRRRDAVSRQEARARLSLSPADRVVLAVNRSRAASDPGTLLGALAELAARGCEFRALLAGAEADREARAPLRRLMRGLVGGRRSTWIGSGPEALELGLRAADVFAGAPVGGAYPVEVLEAMAHGLPVVTTSYRGLAEQVQEGGSAWLVPGGDAATMAAKLDLLLGDEELRRRMGRHGRLVLEFRPSFAEMVERLEHLVATAWMTGPGESSAVLTQADSAPGAAGEGGGEPAAAVPVPRRG